MSDLFATAVIPKGAAETSPMESQLTDLSQIAYPVGGGRTEPLQHFLDSTFTDAFLVVQHGVVLTEAYSNNMRAGTRHLLNSVSKSFVGMAAGIAVDQGALDPGQLVGHYLPELSDGAFRATTVTNALNMTAAVVGWRPDLQTEQAPKSLLEYCQRRTQTEQQEGEHFHYRTVLTNLCAAVVARATGTSFVDFLTQELWQSLGPENDANVVVDATRAPYMGAGMSACARDLARFGEMLCIGIHGQFIYVNRPKALVCVKLSSQTAPTDLKLYAASYRALR